MGGRVLGDGEEAATGVPACRCDNDSDHSAYRVLSPFCVPGPVLRTGDGRKLRDAFSVAQPGGRSEPCALSADALSPRPRITVQPCGACVRTPWKACSSCCCSPSCPRGPWPLPSAACPAPGPSSHPGQEGRGAGSWWRVWGRITEPLLGGSLLMDPHPVSLPLPPLHPSDDYDDTDDDDPFNPQVLDPWV